jgi:ketosteroid isomerase-like protein
MTDVLRGRLRTLYAAMKKGQVDFVLKAIHDDIEFISYSPIKVFPFLGHRRGKPAMSEALRGATEAFEFVACEPISMVIELENAAVMLFTRGVSRMTGRSVQGMLAHFMRFRDGKIVEPREFMDSFHAAEQALGRELIEGF